MKDKPTKREYQLAEYLAETPAPPRQRDYAADWESLKYILRGYIAFRVVDSPQEAWSDVIDYMESIDRLHANGESLAEMYRALAPTTTGPA